jgi:pimeloyl-ACP methyl ester carboxylesterase
VIEYLVGYSRVLHGGERPFDEAASRELIRRDVERASDVAALQNHNVISGADRTAAPLSSIDVPTLVIHGTADPMFPIGHAEALTEEIPGATLLPLVGAGHGVDCVDWPTVVAAILEHTGSARSG